MNCENLQKLATYLRSLPADYQEFDMEVYASDNSFAHPLSCGTAGCAIGHGPNAGIAAQDQEEWEDYSRRVFAITADADEWDWCFGWYWAHTDNTPLGAAQRIEWLLQNGLPENANDQKLGDAPLCYK
jgi:hypothetical protein